MLDTGENCIAAEYYEWNIVWRSGFLGVEKQAVGFAIIPTHVSTHYD